MNMNVIGIIELNSIADGLMVLDGMVKAAPVSILKAEAVNPGKYLIMVGGDVASVGYSMKRGLELGERSLVDQLFLQNTDSQIVSALMKKGNREFSGALGILETLSVTTCIEAADKAVKATEINIIEILSGNELGGKAVLKFTGTLGDIEDAMRVIVPFAESKDQLFRNVIIPGPHTDIKGFVYGN